MSITWSPQVGGSDGPIRIALMEGSPEVPLPFTMMVTPDVDSAAGSFTWTIPATVPSASDYFLQVGDQPDVAYSGTFTIVPATSSS